MANLTSVVSWAQDTHKGRGVSPSPPVGRRAASLGAPGAGDRRGGRLQFGRFEHAETRAPRGDCRSYAADSRDNHLSGRPSASRRGHRTALGCAGLANRRVRYRLTLTKRESLTAHRLGGRPHLRGPWRREGRRGASPAAPQGGRPTTTRDRRRTRQRSGVRRQRGFGRPSGSAGQAAPDSYWTGIALGMYRPIVGARRRLAGPRHRRSNALSGPGTSRSEWYAGERGQSGWSPWTGGWARPCLTPTRRGRSPRILVSLNPTGDASPGRAGRRGNDDAGDAGAVIRLGTPPTGQALFAGPPGPAGRSAPDPYQTGRLIHRGPSTPDRVWMALSCRGDAVRRPAAPGARQIPRHGPADDDGMAHRQVAGCGNERAGPPLAGCGVGPCRALIGCGGTLPYAGGTRAVPLPAGDQEGDRLRGGRRGAGRA